MRSLRFNKNLQLFRMALIILFQKNNEIWLKAQSYNGTLVKTKIR